MPLNPPRYLLEYLAREGRLNRLRTMFEVNFTLRASRGVVLVFLVLGLFLTAVPLIIIVSLAGPGLTLSAFFEPYSGLLLFIFTMLLAALVGGGILADDFATKSISLYLSRPITLFDYLIAKFSVVAAVLSIIVILPPLAAALIAGGLGYISATVTAEAFLIYLGVGLIFVMAFSAVAVFLSSLGDRRAWASAGIFSLLLFAEVVSGLLVDATGNIDWIYLSPWENVATLARSLFGVSGSTTTSSFFVVSAPTSAIDPWVAFAALAALTVALLEATYVRLATVEVGTE